MKEKKIKYIPINERIKNQDISADNNSDDKSRNTDIRSFSQRSKNWSKKKRIIVFSSVGAALLATLILFTYVFQNYLNYNKAQFDTDDLGFTSIISKEVVNIALFGLDVRNETSFKGNSDSIMILSVDKKHNKVKVISVMRDSLVPIEGYGYGKINSAYSYGGAQLAVKTLNQVFDLDISDYATVNFSGMENIIDAVGGIEVELSESERQYANIHMVDQALVKNVDPDYIESAGLQTLNGMQAVAFARIRYTSTSEGQNNDFGRTDRQRFVMEQLFNKAINMSAARYPALVKALLPCSETSLDYGEILSLATFLNKDKSFVQARVPQTEWCINADFNVPTVGSTVYYNLDYSKRAIHSFIYDDIPFEEFVLQNPIDKTGWYLENTMDNSDETSSKTENISSNTNTHHTSSSESVSSKPQTSSNTIDDSVSSRPKDEDVSSNVTSDSENTSSEVSSSDVSSDNMSSNGVSSETGETESENPEDNSSDLVSSDNGNTSSDGGEENVSSDITSSDEIIDTSSDVPENNETMTSSEINTEN